MIDPAVRPNPRPLARDRSMLVLEYGVSLLAFGAAILLAFAR